MVIAAVVASRTTEGDSIADMVDQLPREESGPDVAVSLDRDAADGITHGYEVERRQEIPVKCGILRVDRRPGSRGQHEPVLVQARPPAPAVVSRVSESTSGSPSHIPPLRTTRPSVIEKVSSLAMWRWA